MLKEEEDHSTRLLAHDHHGLIDSKLQHVLSQLSLAENQRLRQLLSLIEFDDEEYLLTVDKCWDPNIILPQNGKTARTTAIEAVQSRGSFVSPCAAMECIMLENPVIFKLCLPQEWIPSMLCGGSFAINRAIYLVERENFSARNAVHCIMFEYFEQFYGSKPVHWNIGAYCDVDGQRVKAWKIGKVWLKTKGYTARECIYEIMSTYPDAFEEEVLHASNSIKSML